MKKTIIYLLLIHFLMISCNKNWENYYGEKNLQTIDESSLTLVEFFQKYTDYSKYYNELKTVGLDSELSKDQQITVWAVDNAAMDASDLISTDTMRMKYHFNYLPFIHTDLKDGLRIRSLTGVYLQITRDIQYIYVNKTKVIKTYVLKNGVVHIIESLLKSRMNMYDYLYNLGDDYSIIRDSIFAKNAKIFDRINSTPIGVDKTGNTLYDSVFYVHNPLFEKAQFNSEFSQFTALIPSNTVINNCFAKLNEQYRLMGKTVTKADTLLAMQWIKEAVFYNGIITDFANKDSKSAFGRIWKDPIQKIDATNQLTLSNGVLFQITELKIPNNVIISRIKSLVHYWQYLTPEQANWYEFTGAELKTDGSPRVSVFVDSATPKPTVLPNYLVLDINGNVDSNGEFSVSFPPLEKYDEGTTTLARKMLVPPGEYNLYMGFHSQGHPYVDILFANDDLSGNYNYKLIGENLPIVLSTPWNFDRVNETEADRIAGGVAKWDGLGGLVGVVNIEGNSMASFRIKVKFNRLESAGASKRLRIYHWTLKPTANNY